jgi:hypothetical protein
MMESFTERDNSPQGLENIDGGRGYLSFSEECPQYLACSTRDCFKSGLADCGWNSAGARISSFTALFCTTEVVHLTRCGVFKTCCNVIVHQRGEKLGKSRTDHGSMILFD